MPPKSSIEATTTHPITSLQSTTIPRLNCRFSYKTAQRTLQYTVPHSKEEIRFVNETEVSPPSTPVSYAWFLNDSAVSENVDYSCTLPETRTTGPHTVRLTAHTSLTSASSEETIDVDPEDVPEYPEWQSRIPLKGVNYHIGRHFMYDYGQPPTPEEMEESLAVIRSELGCNAIKIWGDYEDEMTWCANRAIEMGFTTILLSPRYSRSALNVDTTIEQHLQKIVKFAPRAEELSRKSDSIVLGVGDELTFSTRGITTGLTYDERVRQMEGKGGENYPYANELNAHLEAIVEGVRQYFSGKLTYTSAVGERFAVDWRMFDVVAPHLYLYKDWKKKTMHDIIAKLRKYGKPVYSTEFGSRTFKGAYGTLPEYAGQEYSQADQAKCIQDTMRVYDEAGIDGMFLFAFMLKFENDAESYGILKFDPTRPRRRKLGFYALKSCRPSLG
jgi:hypothetical protein